VQYLGLVIWIIALAGLVYWAQTFDKKNYDLLGKRKYFFALSATLLIISVGSLATKGLKKGLDFSGGTILELGSYQQVTTSQVQDALKGFPGLGGVAVQVGTGMIEDPKPDEGKPSQYQRVIIRLSLEDGSPLQPSTTQECLASLKTGMGDFKELRTASIGPTISGELTRNATKALLLALGAQLIYLFLRFGQQIRYGIAADLAMIHDVTIMLGFYSLSGREIDSPFIAALLTVVGYSVMDSVVIFDRIRENLNDWWAENGEDKEAPYEEVVNASLCQTMSRSANTTLTTLITILAIYYFGGSTLQNFAFALLVGIVGGAYSSVGLASPILCAINAKHPATPPAKGNWYDTDEVVPEDYLEDDEEYHEPQPRRQAQQQRQRPLPPASDAAGEDEMPRSSGRKRSRGRRD
jgi:preprotein translocase subunit SecF